MQFRLRTLLIVTAFSGLVFLGLRMPTPAMSGIISTATLITVLLAILFVVLCRGSARAMAIGYLVLCAGYLIYVTFLAHWLSYPASPIVSLWSLFHQLFEIIHPSRTSSVPAAARTFSQSHFTAICHNSFACLLGVAGAMVAQMLYSQQPNEGSSARSPYK